MADDRKALERLAGTISPGGAPSTIAILSGDNSLGRWVLQGKDVIIRFFPFSIGRLQKRGEALQDADLLIPESHPHRISRNHCLLERRGERLFIVDRSRIGTLVNRKLVGGPMEMSEAPLEPGENRIGIGGEAPPCIFKIRVETESVSPNHPEEVPYGDHILPVSVLHNNFCMRTREFLFSPSEEPESQLNRFRGAFKKILDAPGALEKLYLYSALPETNADLIAEHSVNTALGAIRFARQLSYPADEILDIGMAALLHDAGMIDIPEEIVRKREMVTPDEFKIIQQHPLLGEKRLSTLMSEFPLLRAVVRGHHEREDGSGYPLGSQSVSTRVQLIGMVDFFEAVTHVRPQRGPITPHEGIKILLGSRKGGFQTSLIRDFLRAFAVFPIFSVVQLNNKMVGQVVDTNPEYPLRPKIRILFDADGKAPGECQEIELSRNATLYIARNISDRVFIDRHFQL